MQNDLKKALNDVSRLEIEHRLLFEEADRLFRENMKSQYEIDVLKSKPHISKTALESQFGENEKLKQIAMKYLKEKEEVSA